jgi:hypothetical protein
LMTHGGGVYDYEIQGSAKLWAFQDSTIKTLATRNTRAEWRLGGLGRPTPGKGAFRSRRCPESVRSVARHTPARRWSVCW